MSQLQVARPETVRPSGETCAVSSGAVPCRTKPVVMTLSTRAGHLILGGDLDVASAPAFRARLLAFVEQGGPEDCVIDVSNVSFIDTTGFHTLLEGHDLLRTRGRTMRIHGASRSLGKLIALLGQDNAFRAPVCSYAPPGEPGVGVPPR